MAKSSTSGQGRPKGIPNKITTSLKEMILGALDEAGGQSYLVEQAMKNPNAFLQLVGKIIPSEITATAITVQNNQPMSLEEFYKANEQRDA